MAGASRGETRILQQRSLKHGSLIAYRPAQVGQTVRLPSTEQISPVNFTVLVAPFALVLLAYPAIAATAPQLAGSVFIGIVAILIPLVVINADRILNPAVWALILGVVYILSSLSEDAPAQGIKHTVTLVCFATAFFTFTIYGSELVALRWFRYAAAAIIVINVVSVIMHDFPKNSTGGTLVYLCGIAIILGIRNSQSAGWVAATTFAGATLALALLMGVRFLVICAAVFFSAFACSRFMKWRHYWLWGIVGSAGAIFVVIWFFLNLDRGGLAQELGRVISDVSGHRANSGRDQLYFYLLNRVQESPIFGLGAGTLPRDVLSTEFSAHNYYLQVYLQVGVIGLLAVAAFLLAIWRLLAAAKSTAGRFGSAVFLMFVVHNSAEVLMLQNSALVAIPAWSLIGLALSIEQNQSSPKSGEGRRLPANSTCQPLPSRAFRT